MIGFAYLILITFFALTIGGQVFLVVYHRRKRRKYTLLKGVDHFSKLATGSSLLLAGLTLLYGAYSQEASSKETEKINQQSVSIAKSQTALLQNTVNELRAVSTGLAVNADASERAAHSLDEQLSNEAEMRGRRPSVQVALAIVDPSGGNGSYIGTIDSQSLTKTVTSWVNPDTKSLLIRVQILNSGTATLQEGTVILRSSALDGQPNPTIALEGSAGMKLGDGEGEDPDDPDDPLTGEVRPIAFSNLPTKTMKDLEFRVLVPRRDQVQLRLFRLYIDFVGDAEPRSGIINFHVHFGREFEAEAIKSKKLIDDGQYEDALKASLDGAEKGNINAMNNLALLYQGQKGIKQDCPKVLYWYRAAVALGNQVAMGNLGRLYETGLCVRRDFARARDLYQEAADAGGSDGMTDLGALYEFGHVGHGEKPDYEQALEWFSKAIALGNTTAMNNLGYMYEQGWGVTGKDYDQAKYWYTMAANRGNAVAMSNLGGLYQAGRGVPIDYIQARQWYEKAASAGDPDAQGRIQRLPK